MEKYCLHCFVTGKVQGVWFRANTKKEADRLGLTGFAKNLPDGRVEVMAVGEHEAIIELLEWLKQGPPLAQVTDLTQEKLPWREFVEFSVL